MRFAYHIRTLLLLIVAAVMCSIMSCRDDGIDLPDTQLFGEINGEEWVYEFSRMHQYGFSSTNPNSFRYTFYFFSSSEINSGSCAGGGSTKPHIQVVLPLQIGSYPVLGFGAENLKFVYGNGTVFDATSGSIEILAFGNNKMAGYIQALSDENNFIEGRFIAELCIN